LVNPGDMRQALSAVVATMGNAQTCSSHAAALLSYVCVMLSLHTIVMMSHCVEDVIATEEIRC